MTTAVDRTSADPLQRADELLREMTIEEKAILLLRATRGPGRRLHQPTPAGHEPGVS